MERSPPRALGSLHSAEARSSGVEGATDLDILVGMGFARDAAATALQTTRGDRAAALHILRRGGSTHDASWRNELKDDFVSGMSTKPLPNSVENRALWKTPFYMRVGEPRTRNGKVFYTITVVKKTGESWKVERSYSEFLAMKNRFPLWSTSQFSNAFPGKSLFGSVNTETRRQQLEEWMRELCLDEECMCNEDILKELALFVAETRNLSPAQALAASSASSSTSSYATPATPMSPGATSRYGTRTEPSVGGSAAPAVLTTPTLVASLPEVRGPISFQDLKSTLPFKIPIMGERPLGSDDLNGSKQLAKDYLRDRIIVQGTRRIEGSNTTIPQIVSIMMEVVSQLLAKENKQPLGSSLSPNFFLYLLRKMSRTESAFLSHSSFTELVSSGSSGGGSSATPFDSPSILIVPESGLAEPIKVTFHIKQREGSTGQWCLQADCEAATSFRVNDADSDDMTTLLQVKVTWHKVVFGMPQFGTERGVVGPVVSELTEREGKGLLAAERDTRSTSRDWKMA